MTPPARNSEHLRAAAESRRAETTARAVRALEEFESLGRSVSISAICKRAGVSRTWLYGEPELIARAARLTRLPTDQVPSSQRATENSNRTRLEAALARNRELAEENRRLRHQLARALGRLRENSRHSGSSANL